MPLTIEQINAVSYPWWMRRTANHYAESALLRTLEQQGVVQQVPRTPTEFIGRRLDAMCRYNNLRRPTRLTREPTIWVTPDLYEVYEDSLVPIQRWTSSDPSIRTPSLVFRGSLVRGTAMWTHPQQPRDYWRCKVTFCTRDYTHGHTIPRRIDRRQERG